MTLSGAKRKLESSCPSDNRFNRRVIYGLVAILLFWPAVLAALLVVHYSYAAIDPMQFPYISESVRDEIVQGEAMVGGINDAQKASMLVTAITAQLQRELDSPFGWTVNDLLISPTAWPDDRDNRQSGVLFATRMLLQFFGPNVTKLGPTDKENPLMKDVRERHIVYGEDVWGFFRASAENQYKKTLEKSRQYIQDVVDDKAVFNMRTDDIYNVLTLILSENFSGQVMGLLTEPNEFVNYSDLDDRVYYAQGVTLVIRDFMKALVAAYPDIAEKGGTENLQAAFFAMDKICTFYPLFVWRGQHDSMFADHRSKVARYTTTWTKRVNDIAQSVRN